jgi:Protein of unknown function (DUF3307)
MEASLWLTRLLLSHLLTDFLLQPNKWIIARKEKHFASMHLYLHGFITAVFAWLFTGWQYWWVALVILVTHILIDGWKSFQTDSFRYFIIDQFLHLLVILACWLAVFYTSNDILVKWQEINGNAAFWKIATGIVFLTMPAGILIGKLTQHWRINIADAESLENAGKWIGIAERLIIVIFVLNNQYSAIGLLVAAKGIIRFNEKDRPEIKTEYLVIGTLLSIVVAVVTGLLIR